VAPEVLKNIPYDQSADMWSVGVIIFLLLSGSPPFVDDDQSELFRKIRTADWKFRGEEWEGISYEARSVVKKLLVANPLQRATARQALKSSWFRMENDNSPSQRMTKIYNQQQPTLSKSGLRDYSQQPAEWSNIDESERDGQRAVERVLSQPEAEERKHGKNGAPAFTMIPVDELNGKIETTKPLVHDAKLQNNQSLEGGRQMIENKEQTKIDEYGGSKVYKASYSPVDIVGETLLRDDIGTSGHEPRRNLLDEQEAPLIQNQNVALHEIDSSKIDRPDQTNVVVSTGQQPRRKSLEHKPEDREVPIIFPRSKTPVREFSRGRLVTNIPSSAAENPNEAAQRLSSSFRNYNGQETTTTKFQERRKDPDGVIPSDFSKQSEGIDYRRNPLHSEVEVLKVERVTIRRRKSEKRLKSSKRSNDADDLALERLEI
jgi:serine/threonine protein kinase